MSVPLIVNDAVFNYPTEGDPPDWGFVTTAWATAVTNGLIPKTGGNFTLTGELDFGNNYGIRIKDMALSSPFPIATVGAFRFNQEATIAWRNHDNTANLELGVNVLNQLTLNGVPIGGSTGSVPGGVNQLLAANGAGDFSVVPYGTAGQVLTSNGSGTAWVDQGSIVSGGTIDNVSTLPGTGTEGQVVFLTTDGQLYRYFGGAWTVAVPAVNISGQITNGQIQDSAITAVKLGAAAVTASKLNVAAVDALGNLATGTVGTTQLVDNAVSSLKILNGAITADKTNILAINASTGGLANDTVGAAQILNNAVTSLKLLDGAVTANKTSIAALNATTGGLNSAVVDAAQLVAGAVQAVALANGAVTAAKTNLSAIDPSSGTLAINAVTTNSIQAGSIVAGKLATDSVVAANIKAGEVVAGKLAADAVVAANIKAGEIVAGKLAANAVTFGTVAAGAITTTNLTTNCITSNELASNSVVAGKIFTGAVVAGNIAANAVQAGNLAANSVTAGTLAAGAVTTGTLAAGVVTATELAAGAVTASKLSVIIGSGNFAPNSSFEALASGNRPLYYAEYNNASISTTYLRPTGRSTGTFAYGLQANSNSSSTFGVYTTNGIDSATGSGGVKNGWVPNTTYMVSFYARKVAGSGWSNMGLGWNVAPTSTTNISNPALTTSFQRYIFRIVMGSSVESNGSLYLTVLGTTTVGDQIIIDDVQVEEGDTATAWSPAPAEVLPGTIVANMLAVDSVQANAIAANAITAGKIATNAVTAGTISTGSIDASKIVAGTFQADNALTRGLTVRDNSGNVILAAGIPLTSSNITPASNWLNNNITLNSNGTLSGAGGGAVTVAGLDNSIVRSSNPINAANITTYIQSAAIGAAQIGSVNASTITTGSLNAALITSGTITTDKLVAGAVTAANDGGQSSTNYTAISTNSVNSGVVSIFSMTTTGAPVIVGGQGQILVTSILPITTAKSGLIRLNLYIDGVFQGIQGEYRLPPFQSSGNQSTLMVTIPISARVTGLAAGSHTFQWLALGGFYDGTGIGLSTNYTMTLLGNMWALENKV